MGVVAGTTPERQTLFCMPGEASGCVEFRNSACVFSQESGKAGLSGSPLMVACFQELSG